MKKISKISIIIPAYNEEKTLEEIIKRVSRAPTLGLNKEIIIVNDGSTDKTQRILNKYKKRKEFKIINKIKNEGKGNALRTGFKVATGNIIIVQDADLEYDPNDYPLLIEPILKGETSIVYGSRFLKKMKGTTLSMFLMGKNEKTRLRFYLGGTMLTIMVNVLYNAKITDEATCYKVFKREVLKRVKLKCRRFEFCPEFTAKARKNKFKIKEVPINYNPRSIEEGKKIKVIDGLYAIWILIKYRFIN